MLKILVISFLVRFIMNQKLITIYLANNAQQNLSTTLIALCNYLRLQELSFPVPNFIHLIKNPSKYDKSTSYGAVKYIKNLVFDPDTGEILETAKRDFC